MWKVTFEDDCGNTTTRARDFLGDAIADCLIDCGNGIEDATNTVIAAMASFARQSNWREFIGDSDKTKVTELFACAIEFESNEPTS